ncbi:hypothetical protein GXP71_00490 [Cellulomonas sp. H30R-01]|uniref:hypothetical protein n=1 Tax=Cellulomonas sp. H30R-01 TaxID=2704467 RepID=UPI00138D5388|nr:hypothetical protein [Cellulomonas sp. H30R-01]QHT54727.1 hypothetical protein GXP71_00490 [Cellulomonas sp. H30R-01]
MPIIEVAPEGGVVRVRDARPERARAGAYMIGRSADRLTAVDPNETLYYWSAIAQLLPVLGLALVLEVRFLIRHALQQNDHARLRRLGWPFGAVLILAVVAEAIALRALQSHETSSEWTVMFAEFVVLAAFSTLVFTPGLAVALMVFPRLLQPATAARAAWLGISIRWTRRRHVRDLRARDRHLAAQGVELARLETLLHQARAKIEEARARGATPQDLQESIRMAAQLGERISEARSLTEEMAADVRAADQWDAAQVRSLLVRLAKVQQQGDLSARRHLAAIAAPAEDLLASGRGSARGRRAQLGARSQRLVTRSRPRRR